MKIPHTPPPAANPAAQKISVSLFEADMAQIDAIADFVKAKAGVRLNTSQAIKSSCGPLRRIPGSWKHGKAVQADDGRRRPIQADGPRPKRQRKSFEVKPTRPKNIRC